MRDQANRHWLLDKEAKQQHLAVKNKIAFAITVALLVIALISFMALLQPEIAEEDLMVSHDMQFYIETYGVTVDEYGVE